MNEIYVYMIGSDEQIHRALINELNRDYISINKLEFICKLFYYSYEAIKFEDFFEN